ncbi:MAG TPA: DUF1223 domain-containing protein [Chitinophagaceae bacterium]|jgi:hypothetical protein|nr:DUF1223 domain-containing protein [Chitinophagaceae bacterium]
MKWLLVATAFAILACSGFAGKTKPRKEKILHPRSLPHSFAILELFTSEGCSSCPPADRLLPQLALIDSNIIPLSFHVDYWDHLGWKDPFSSSIYTDRQRQYAQQFQLESIYTPQLVINGEYELVGSNRSSAKSKIREALVEKNEIQLEIAEIKKENNKLLVSVNVKGNFKDANLLAVVVQKHAEMSVRGGENRGAKLSHTNVVRSFIKLPTSEKMNFEISIPDDLANNDQPASRQGWQLVIYTQQKDLKITGVAVYNGQ